MNLKKIRLDKNLSRPDLVKLTGIPLRTIENIEKRDDCKVSTALKLAKVLGVSLDDLCKPAEE